MKCCHPNEPQPTPPPPPHPLLLNWALNRSGGPLNELMNHSERQRSGPVDSQGPGSLTFFCMWTHIHANIHTHTQHTYPGTNTRTHWGLIRAHSHPALMILALIHTHFSRLCVYRRASQAPPLCHSYHSAFNGERGRRSPPICPFRGRDEIYRFFFFFFSMQTTP